MNLSFDVKGYLKPYKKIEIRFGEFKHIFVDNFDKSSSRHQLFKNYEKYITAFNKEITTNYVQWIDGSFVTAKENPKDIDFVTLINFDIFEENEQLIESKFRLKGASITFEGIDAYTLKVYPEHHKRRRITEFDKSYWLNWFSETKKNRLKKKFPKGFVEIKFGENE